MDEGVAKKLRVLADAAKYDASCASSGAPKRAAASATASARPRNGICHAYTPDGRCVSLLKILLTNYCLFDCAYCINRRSSNVAARAVHASTRSSRSRSTSTSATTSRACSSPPASSARPTTRWSR